MKRPATSTTTTTVRLVANDESRPITRDPLRWGLVIATYKRPDMLRRCLENALRQTCLPAEIVIVDASPDLIEQREQTLALLRREPAIEVTYLQAQRASLPAQRNQGIARARSEVLFLIDDDSMMYPDCAEEVLKVYEADTDQLVSGVMCMPTSTPPDADLAPNEDSIAPSRSVLRRLGRALLDTQSTWFLPYDGAYPHHEVPEQLRGLDVGVVRLMPGYAMTFRRSVLLKEPFAELLDRYAAGEDQDLSYRASRHGALLLAHRAKLCHLEVAGGRLSRRTTTALADLNPAALQVLYSDDLERSRRDWKRIVQRRLLIRALKDLAEREWKFERTRGTLLALQKLDDVYAHAPELLRSWYGEQQAELISSDPAR